MHDITRSVSPTTAVWPGDQPPRWSWTARLSNGDDAVNVGHLCMSMHTGSHVDAPFHVCEDGATTDDLPLSSFLGTARVVEIGSDQEITPSQVPDTLSANRLLFKTPLSNVPDDQWPEQVPAILPETVRLLEQKGVNLVGTDAPSIDHLDSKTLPGHHAFRQADIIHLEGLCMKGVPPGSYQLISLPLRVPGADAAPIRAVLRNPVDL